MVYLSKVEPIEGFEPPNSGFADHGVRPLHHMGIGREGEHRTHVSGFGDHFLAKRPPYYNLSFRLDTFTFDWSGW